ncbi:MAG TPA: prepilin-type N-terminal cleavage/methylation domain-containing protein [Longimicrobiaceae bacterium]
MSYAELPRGRAGFTLIEVMVAIVLSLLLGGVIYQVLRGETRFAAVQGAREEVQQNARGALEILSSELRSAQAAGLVSATANSITFYVPRVWGISCATGTTGQMSVVFPDLADPGVMFDLSTATGVMGNTGTVAAPTWGPAANAARATVTSTATINLAVAGNACSAIRSTANPGIVRALTINGANLPQVPAGQAVYLYQWVRYDVAQVDGAWWIRRSLGAADGTNQQPLAGPLTGSTGLAFTYWDAAGNSLGSAPANLLQVARIGITVSARSTSGAARLTETQTSSVQLRN